METPGTAPGSDPFIASAFMSIVPKDKAQYMRTTDGVEGQKTPKANIPGPPLVRGRASGARGAFRHGFSAKGHGFTLEVIKTGHHTWGVFLFHRIRNPYV